MFAPANRNEFGFFFLTAPGIPEGKHREITGWLNQRGIQYTTTNGSAVRSNMNEIQRVAFYSCFPSLAPDGWFDIPEWDYSKRLYMARLDFLANEQYGIEPETRGDISLYSEHYCVTFGDLRESLSIYYRTGEI